MVDQFNIEDLNAMNDVEDLNISIIIIKEELAQLSLIFNSCKVMVEYSPVQNSCRFYINKRHVAQHPLKIHFSIISQPIMGNKVNAARRHSHKHSSTSLKRQNSNPSSNASTKRVKKPKLNATTSPPSDTMPSPSETLEEAIENVLDTQNQLFTISYCIMLGSTPVEEDAERVKLGEFKYRNFEVQAIKTVDRAATKAGCGFEWQSGKAVVSAKLVGKDNWIIINVADDTAWKKVEQFVEDFMRAGKKEIKVKLMFIYNKKRGQDMLDSDSEEEGSSKKVLIHSNAILITESNRKTHSEVKTTRTYQWTACQCSS